MTLEIGQKLWVVLSRNTNQSFEGTVVTVGRKWATLDGYRGDRVNVETLHLDGGQYSSPGRAYLSRELYEQERDADKAWSELQHAISRTRRNNSATTAAILEAGRLLGLALRPSTGKER